MPINNRNEFFDDEVLEMFPEAFQQAEQVAGQAFSGGEEFTEEDEQRRRELAGRKRRLQPVEFRKVQGGRIGGNPYSVDYSPLTNAILSGAQSVINAERQRRLIGDPEKAEELSQQAKEKRQQAKNLKRGDKSAEASRTFAEPQADTEGESQRAEQLQQQADQLEQQAEEARGVLLPLQELQRQRKQARQDEKAESEFARSLFQQFSQAGMKSQRQQKQFERQKTLTDIEQQNRKDLARLENRMKKDLVDYERQAKEEGQLDLSQFRKTVDDITSSQQNVINRLESQKEDVQRAIQWKNLPETAKTQQRFEGNAPNVPQSLLNKSNEELREQADSLQTKINETGKRIDRINKDLYERTATIFDIPVERARQLFEGRPQQGQSGQDGESFEEFDTRMRQEIGNTLRIINSGQQQQRQQSPDPGTRPPGTQPQSSDIDTVINDFSSDFN